MSTGKDQFNLISSRLKSSLTQTRRNWQYYFLAIKDFLNDNEKIPAIKNLTQIRFDPTTSEISKCQYYQFCVFVKNSIGKTRVPLKHTTWKI